MLRCKPGDLAIVLRSESGRDGIIISVLEYVGEYAMTNGETLVNGWRVSNPYLDDQMHYFAEDKNLLPIRPGDLKEADETEKEVESV